MSDYFFGLGPGWLPKQANTIAKRHEAWLCNHTDPQCSCGHGCAPNTCKNSRRHWFATVNWGEPYDSATARKVMDEIEGI
jgi:hypothetical protein